MGGFFTGGGATPYDIWNYATRTLTQAKFPFWSAIITIVSPDYFGVPTGSFAATVIRPPSGETWLVFLCATYIDNTVAGSYIMFRHCYDLRMGYPFLHCTTGGYYGSTMPHLSTPLVIDNANYVAIYAYNADTVEQHNVYYTYSGFKLSQPFWSPKRLTDTGKPFKQPTDLPLPDPLKPLDKYKALILGIDPARPNEYALGIILEEDTPLAIDPTTGFPVERKSAYVKADVLADLITKFKSGAIDYAKAGYEQYLRKWKKEGIDLGIV
jgi:hypothetical protein